MKTLKIKSRVFRFPFAELFRPLTDLERGRLENSIEEYGIQQAVTVYTSPVHGKSCVIDGMNRLEIGAATGKPVPIVDKGKMGDPEARELAVTMNADRRHLTPSEQQEARAQRVERVAEARASGDSLRTIAEKEGVSEKQIRNDLKNKASTADPSAVDAPKTRGKDGRDYKKKPKTPPSPTKQGVPGSILNPPEPEPEAASEPVGDVDGWGIPIQPHAKEAFASRPLFEELLTTLRRAMKQFNEAANAPGGVFLQQPGNSSYRRGAKDEDGKPADRFVHEGLERCLKQVKALMPTYTVCPYNYADGDHPTKCTCCRGLNWTPELSDSIPPLCISRAKAALGGKEIG